MYELKKYLSLIGLLFSMAAGAQKAFYHDAAENASDKHSLGIGFTASMPSRIQSKQGNIPVRPVQWVGFFVDYQQAVPHSRLHLSWGSRLMLCFYKGWWDLYREVPYYQPSVTDFSLDKLDQAELFLYGQQQMVVFNSEQFSCAISWKLGPAFSINNHLHRLEGLVDIRRDNGNAFQVCTVFQEKRQPIWLPYLRAGFGLKFVIKTRKGASIKLSPFWEMAALQVDQLNFTTLPDDAENSSFGKFTWNRNQAGLQFSLSRAKAHR